MELGVISLSDIQIDPSTGQPYPYEQRIEEILGYATRADRAGLDVFSLDLLLELRANPRLTWSGTFRAPLHDAPVTPRASQDPRPVSAPAIPRSSASGSRPTSTQERPPRPRGRASPTTTSTCDLRFLADAVSW